MRQVAAENSYLSSQPLYIYYKMEFCGPRAKSGLKKPKARDFVERDSLYSHVKKVALGYSRTRVMACSKFKYMIRIINVKTAICSPLLVYASANKHHVRSYFSLTFYSVEVKAICMEAHLDECS